MAHDERWLVSEWQVGYDVPSNRGIQNVEVWLPRHSDYFFSLSDLRNAWRVATGNE